MLCVAAASAGCATASDFFSTEKPDRIFTFGLRAGVNTSNSTLGRSAFNAWNADSWGNGVDVGAVVSLHFRDWISIQPGFFLDYRCGKYAYAGIWPDVAGEPVGFTLLGDRRSVGFHVPVLASVRFNVTDNVVWSVDAGPYLDFTLGHNSDDLDVDLTGDGVPVRFETDRRSFDFGVKMGMGLSLRRHWCFGIHYLAGCLAAWDNGFGGHNKMWSFTLGYDF